MSVNAEPENALDSLHVALHRDGVVPLLGASLDSSVPQLGECLRAAIAALPAAERPALEALAAAGVWSSVVDALGPGLQAPESWPEGVLPPIFEKLGRLPFELALTTSWRVPAAGKAGEARGPRYVPLLGTLKERSTLRFLPEPPSSEIERLLARRRLWIVADSLGDADLLVLLESWASYLPPRTEEKHVILARRGTSLEQGRWRRWGFVVVLREDLETALAELARSPVVPAVPRPRLLVAGPHFGLSAEVAREVEKVWQESGAAGEDARFNTLDKLRAYDEVARQQVAALATCDVVIDFSPWRAFSRWLSRGAGDFEQEQRVEAPAQIFFEAGEGAARERFARAAERFPDRGRRFQEVLGSQAAYSGFEEGNTSWQQDWPELVSAVVLENCEEVELGLAEYRRALQVAAGQVRLLGDALERPLQEVYVDLELEPIELGALREDGEKAEESQREQGRGLRVSRPTWGQTLEDIIAIDGIRDFVSPYGVMPKRPGNEANDEERQGQELEEVLRSRRAKGQRSEPTRLLPPLGLAGLAPRVFVLGLPGTGKTTLLKWLATRLAAEGDTLPIWVRLADLASGEPEKLLEQAIDAARLPDGPALRSALRQSLSGNDGGRVLLLLDGFDEAHELVRTGLGDYLAKLGPHVTLVLSSRPTTREAPDLLRQQFRSVRLGGLLPGGAETFLRSYFGDAGWISNLIRDLHRMREASAWLNTPVLLSLAAVLYRRDRVLPEATLELYEAVVSELFTIAARRARLPMERIPEARVALENFARQKLFPGAGKKAAVVFSRAEVSALPGSLLIQRSGLLAGGEQLRFAHLTLGEYVAARSLREELPGTVGKAELDLEVLPMALALAGEEALAAWWQKAAADGEPWAFLVLLRALALAGPGVQAFAKGYGVQVLEEVVRRLMPASGRLGETELELARRAERALWGMAKVLPAGCWEVFDELAALPGKLGFEGKVLQRRAGDPTGNRLAATRLDSARSAGALLDGGTELDQLFELTQGEWANEVRVAAVQALASIPEARTLIQTKLDDDDPEVRAAAVQALASIPEARTLIQTKLDDHYSTARTAAVQALASVPEACALIQTKLDDVDANVRAAAVQALASVPEVRPLIQTKLDDSDANVRAAAVQALAFVPEARARIQAKLDDRSSTVRAAAVKALASAPEARAGIQSKLDDYYPSVRAAAVQALASDPKARLLIQTKLDDVDWKVRAAAVQSLASVPEARAGIQSKLDDVEPNVRTAAVQSLASVPEARPFIQTKLDDRFPNVRAAAVQSLASVPEARALIQAKLDDVEPYVRAVAVWALASVPEARALIQTKLDDHFSNVRAAAVQSLASVPEARALIQAKLDDDEPDVRVAAVQALASVPEARALIQAKLDDDEPYVRAVAVQVLASVPEARALIQTKLDDDDANVRIAAVQALASVPEARALIQPKLDDGSSIVRAAAVQALASVPEARALIQTKLDDGSSTVCAAAVQALASVPEARALIQAKLDDDEPYVRAAAEQALQKQGLAAQVAPARLGLRLPLRLSGRDPQPGMPLTREDLLLQERLSTFLQAPTLLHLEKEPQLGLAVLDWLLVRLGWASPVADWPGGGRFFGDVRDVADEKGRRRFVRVAMLDWDLWQERRISAFSNLFEAWRVAAYLRTRIPTTCWLLCADLDWSCFSPPELEPGEVHYGPTYYGFRLLEAEAEAAEIDLFQLAASTNARQLWQSLDEPKRVRFLEELAVIAGRVDFTPWALLTLVASVGDLLPEGLRATFAHKLPPSAAPTVDLLARAREALGASATTGLLATAAATSNDAELTWRREALQQILTVRRPAAEALAAGVEHLEVMPALLAALKVPNETVTSIYDFFDRFQDLAREKTLQERLRTALDALPAPAPSFETRRHEIRHLIDVFLKSRR